MIAWKAPPHLCPRQYLVRQVVQLARLPRALEDPLVGRPGVDRAGDVQEPLPRDLLDLPPQLVRAAQQQHVRGMLIVGQADDARVPVRGTPGMRNAEPFQAQHPLAPSREVVACRAAHAPHANHDHVVAVGVYGALHPNHSSSVVQRSAGWPSRICARSSSSVPPPSAYASCLWMLSWLSARASRKSCPGRSGYVRTAAPNISRATSSTNRGRRCALWTTKNSSGRFNSP